MPLLTDPARTEALDTPGADGTEPVRAWRSLEEWHAGGPGREALSREHPPGAMLPPEGVARRTFLQAAAASLAAAGFSGCFRQPPEKILPYSTPPEGLTPGVPLHFATGLEWSGRTVGLVVESHEGRPTKVEGNPLHPASLGAAGIFEQASLLGLYDPARAKAARLQGVEAAWSTVRDALRKHAGREDQGAGLRFLVEPTSSPLVQALYARIQERFPSARIIPCGVALADGRREGTRLAYGRVLDVVHDVGRAVVVAVDDDFLATTHPGHLRAARDFVNARKPDAMNRLWVAESTLSITGGFADERLRMRPSQGVALMLALAEAVGNGGDGSTLASGLASLRVPPTALTEAQRAWVRGAARDLLAHRGQGRVTVGPRQPPLVHELAFAMDEALGNTPRLLEPVALPDGGPEALTSLLGEMRGGRVDTLIITAWNPAWTAMVEADFARHLERVPFRLYHGLHEDETAALCPSFVPGTHPFESWRDGRAPDGTASVLQPLIAPLFPGAVSEVELLSVFAGVESRSPYELLKSLWRERAGSPPDFEARWETWLADGVIPETQAPPARAVLNEAEVIRDAREVAGLEFSRPIGAMPDRRAEARASHLREAPEGLELSLVLDSRLYDGRFAGNAWLQELPDPVTKLTWDNAALLSPATARALSLEKGDVARIELLSQAVEVPVLVLPGQPDDTVTLALGHGRERVGPVGQGVGVNANALRIPYWPWGGTTVSLARTGRHHALALTQEHWSMEGRQLALQLPQASFRAKPQALRSLQEDGERLYPPNTLLKSDRHQWAMAIDLHRCTGCSACMVACQSENNVPVVGRDGVLRSREMHWLRIDRYFLGDPDDPGFITQPVACVHCEAAPCEYVCPVNATVHSDEGLNQMVYNRCIGTRYCSNNCPYKVRRFNYLEYQRREPLARLRQNPDVTVRSRGVMEKCTYCVQRIERARTVARAAQRDVRDGEVRTACQQACPTEAITFGDLLAPESRVRREHEDPRHYKLLNTLGTRPRTVHLVRLKNPAPEGGA
ncbi:MULTISPECIES: TAT-variant-translocated molybdopterin oxidoreductase [unclassified Corallococcus]|uniref:TAT-variant-translocated molybdopterin oxidoreductase n=1 Tax=unclassified Corallococcus TaxID=2685029 RepID=UPI001A8E9634|nr:MULTISPECIES: TAT-variant-translocated molybdopterin oxidoreductase [unclassified Corallococcus]MBN9681495.1 TAT-variant-translocated molybdopterin oxidoreductase [Corallococcus sp. NCSPR001]WAS86929.1 TAT-variant-translocated molybdopterin oxidoreductase [Corallococcus sp. NCRR]